MLCAQPRVTRRIKLAASLGGRYTGVSYVSKNMPYIKFILSISGSSQKILFTIQYIYNVLYIELYGKGSQMTTNHFDIEVFHIYYAAGGMI